MKKLMCIILSCLTISTIGCLSEEEKERADKYSLRYVYVDEIIELKDKLYTKKFFFTAKFSSERLIFKLFYPHFYRYFTHNDKDKKQEIHQSLIGLSLEMYDKDNNSVLYSYQVIELKQPYFSMATPSLSLGGPPYIRKGYKYEVVLKIPNKNDTKSQYLKPIFVIGIVESPSL